MRTTLTLDEDVAANLGGEMRRTGASFKKTVNDVLRRGLAAGRKAGKPQAVHIQARDLGLRAGLDLSNVWDLIDQLEDAGRP